MVANSIPPMRGTLKYDLGDAKATQALSLRFDWAPIGKVSLDACGRLSFPSVPGAPGLYQFKLAPDIFVIL